MKQYFKNIYYVHVELDLNKYVLLKLIIIKKILNNCCACGLSYLVVV